MESRLLLSTQVPLCLDPSTDVACVTNRLCYNQLKFNSNSLKHYLHRRSHANRNTKAGNITRRLPRFHGLFTGHRKVSSNTLIIIIGDPYFELLLPASTISVSGLPLSVLYSSWS